MYYVPEHVFITPTTIIVSGATGSGKTTWLKKLLENQILFSSKPSKIIYCYGAWQPGFEEMEGVDFREGLNIPENKEKEHMLIILDDLMTEVVQSSTVQGLFTEGSHHNNITVIFVLQNLFQQGKHARSIMLNSHYIILMKNPRDIQQVKLLGRQLGQEKVLEEAYKDSMKKQYSYLLIDLSPHQTNDDLRLVSNIFPEENLIVYLSK